VVALAAFWLAPAAPDFPLDDAWIHLDYAQGLIRDGTFAYNQGRPEAGFTSPLWVLAETPVLLACNALSASPVLPAKALSLALGLFGALALARLVVTLGGGPIARWFSLLLLWSSPWWVFASISGMEVTLFSTLLLLALDRSMHNPGWGAGALWALALLARPEAVLPGSVVVGWTLLQKPRGRALFMALPPLVVALAWGAWWRRVSGHPLPNTFAVKAFSGGGIWQSLGHVGKVLLPAEGVWRVLLVAVLTAFGLRRADPKRRTALVLGVALSIGVVLATHPLSPSVRFYHARYLLPFLAPCLALGAMGAEALAERFKRGWVFGLVSGVGLLALSWPALLDQRESYQGHCLEVQEVHTLPAFFVADHLPKGGTVATEAAGSLRYHLPPDRDVLDLLGLNDHFIAWNSRDQDARSCYILGSLPQLILVPDGWQQALAPAFRQEVLSTFESFTWTAGDGTYLRRVLLIQATPRTGAWDYCRRRFGGTSVTH